MLASSAALLSGCVFPETVAKSMYAAQYNCPEEDLAYKYVASDRAIMVSGCGYRQLYACNPNGACIRDGERTPVAEKNSASRQ
jgi:hypothetical protein